MSCAFDNLEFVKPMCKDCPAEDLCNSQSDIAEKIMDVVGECVDLALEYERDK